tara:strand:- start:2157 stop:2348 length:192 start_codon:yes stop_codon:yes gene_type:complete
MIKTRFENTDFTEFILTLRDLNDSLSEWEKKSGNNWDIEIGIGENIYIIYVEIYMDEDNNKSK